MSYENCGSAHQIEELDHEFDNSAFDLNKLLDQALSRKHAKHDYEDPIIHHFSRYNSNHLIRLHAADKSFNSYEGGSVAELAAVEIHRDENDIPINHQSNSSALQNRIETRDKRPQSDDPLQNIHENSKLTTNKSHTSSAKRLDVLEDQSQDGKVPHYFKDQYQNTRKTSAAKDDYGFSGEFNKNSHSEANQSHPYNNNSLTDSEKISEIMHLAYLKGRGQGTEPSDGGAGIEFMSKEPSMIELSNKDFENSPKATEEDDLEEYKYEESEQRNPHHQNVQISNQLREILVPISQAENESEDSESERISPSDLLPDNENENIRKAQQENLEEAIALDDRKGSIEYKRDEKSTRGQRYPTEMSPASASESIDEFVASRFSGISPRDPRGSITKGDILTEGQLLSSRSQKEEERVETQENRETEGDQLETHEKIQEQSEEEEENENFQTCQSGEIVAELESGVTKRVNQEEKVLEGTDMIQEQSEEEEEMDNFKTCQSEGVIREQSEEEEEVEDRKRSQAQAQHQEKLVETESSQIEGEIIKETENIKEPQEEEEAILGTESETVEASHQEHKVNEETDAKSSKRKESQNFGQVDSSQFEELAENASSKTVVESAQIGSADYKSQEEKTDSNDVESQEKKQADKISNEDINEAAKRVEEISDLQGSEVQSTAEIRQTLEENIKENDQKNPCENSENVNQDSSEMIQNKEINSENQAENATNSVKNEIQESIHNSENKGDNQNEKEITHVEKKGNKQTDEKVEETGNAVEQGSEGHEGTSEIRQALEENIQENAAQKDSTTVEIKTQEELAQTEILKSTERVDQDSSEAAQKKEDQNIHSIQGNAQKESITNSGKRADEDQDKDSVDDKEETGLNNTQNKENNQHERVKETGNVNEQSSEVHEGTSEIRQALDENAKGDPQKDSSTVQEEVVKTDIPSQLGETTQGEETKIENKAQNTVRSVHDDAQNESINISENREDNHDENVDPHGNKVSGNGENKKEENTEGQNHQTASNHENQNQRELDATAEAEKRSGGEDVVVSEQKKEAQGIEEGHNNRREASLDEETKEAREEHKKSPHERNMKESESRDHIEESEGEKLEGSMAESVKELEATEATARNRENDADHLTETQNETDAHTEKLDEKLISAVGSIKEFEGEEGNIVNHDAQIITEEANGASNAQQQEVNETEKSQNKSVSAAESVTVIVKNKTDKQEASEETEDINNAQQNSCTAKVVSQETEFQKNGDDNSDLPAHTQEVKSDKDVTSNAAVIELNKGSETPETIIVNQETHVAPPHTQAQSETENLAAQQNKEIEKSQENLASEAFEGSSAPKKQEDKAQKENTENEKCHPEAQNLVTQGSAKQENTIKANQTSEISNDNKQSSNNKDSQDIHQKHHNESSSSSSEIQKEERPTTELPHENSDKIQSESAKNKSEVKKNPDHLHSETRVNSIHNNTMRTIDEEHKSSSEITHNILDLTKNSELKRASKTTSPPVLDHNDKLQINRLLEQIQEEESKENIISPQHIQTQQEQPTQEAPHNHNAAVSTPVKPKKEITTTTASTGTDFILHKTQIEEKGTQTEAETEPEEKEAPPIIPIQKVTHFRSLSTTKKKQRSTFRLFEKSVGEYEKDIDFMSKYTTKEVIQNLHHTPEQMEALFESAKKLYKITDDTPRGPPSDDELYGILNRVVVSRSPVKEGRYDYSLIPIYQQVEETYEDGTRYEGEKFLGKRHGAGTYYYKEGYKYVGNWEQDVMSGFGVLWLNENEKWYEGEWANNVFHGRGSLYNTNPEKLDEEKAYLENFDEIGHGWKKYEGQFFEGKRHRFGTILLSNGDVFVGNFKENKAEGRGSYTKANKKMIVGEWCDNKLKKVF